jgi:isopropylmalate/homocitrate/citramalate synthase
VLKPLQILDSTLCEGLPSAGLEASLGYKLHLAQHLSAAGVDAIEAGYPARSSGDFATVKAVSEAVRTSVIVARARPSTKEIQTAWEAIQSAAQPRIKITMPTSPIFMQYTLRITPVQACRQLVEAVSFARGLGVEVQVMAEDATRSDWNFLSDFFSAAVEAGASVVGIQDSVGRLTPKESYDIVRHLRATVEGIHTAKLSIDCRHDFGVAIANALGAAECGIQQVECTLSGIGFPLGRVPLEAFALALNAREDRYRVKHRLDPLQLPRLTAMLANINHRPGDSAYLESACAKSLEVAPTVASPDQIEAFHTYEVHGFQVTTDDDGNCRAEVRIQRKDGEIISGTGAACNQPEALHQAISQTMNFSGVLVEYFVKHNDEQSKQVIVCVEHGGRVATGEATARTVLQASARAFLHAIEQVQ